MPGSVTLSQLSFRTPDGRSLFDRLELSFGPQRTGLVGRNGTGKTTLLRLIAGELTPLAGNVAVAGRIGMLRQTPQTAAGQTVADFAGVAPALRQLAQLERGEGSAETAAEADWTLPHRLAEALAEVGLPGLAPERPVETLSGGQRTRVALAGLLLAAPDLLLLDEPTNNLDAAGRAAIGAVLGRWRGGAIVVSHDRALLREMDAIVELTSLGATSYGGNFDHYRARKALALAAAERALGVAERQVAAVEQRAQAEVERQARRDGAGKHRKARGGAPRILTGALQRNAEQTAGEHARLASRQRRQAAEQAAAARQQVEVLQPLTVALPSTRLPAGRRVLVATALSGGPAARPVVRDFDLAIVGPERLAITGPNGSGKTTLLRLLTGELPAMAGNVHRFCRHAFLDQSMALLDAGETIRDNYRRLNPEDDENACRAALARFRFRAEAALQLVGTLSGGEMLRAGLAATIGAKRPPELLLLDEPTNHLDFEAIEAVEAGLRGYDGALVVVSHDRDFLAAIGTTREIARRPAGAELSRGG